MTLLFNNSLISKSANSLPSSGNKITIVGIGQVGIACAVSILAQNVSDEICLISRNGDVLTGEMMDLQHGSIYLSNPKITASTDYTASAGSRLCIITTGECQKEGETRLSLLQRNVDMLKEIIPKLIKNSPDTMLLMVTNPVDTLTYVAWKLSGLPKNRVMGSGTSLESARLRFLMSQRLNVEPTSCQGWVIGEHGDSSVVVWSSINVEGVSLIELHPSIGTAEDIENWNELHEVLKEGHEDRKLTGCTTWAISLCVAAITSAILKNYSTVIAVTTSVMGEHGIDKDVFLSLPCVINSNGVTSIERQNLTLAELQKFRESANLMAKVQDGVQF